MKIRKETERNIVYGLLGILALFIWFVATYQENHYTRTGAVHYVSPFCYELTDETGHSFEFITNDIFKDGTIITAILDNKGSVGYVYDDEVIDYKIVLDSEE